ncbi:MAG: guanylate kinase [Candidatus Latescibacterota bacterium]|nr:MAG: guanylate kinase [Candidatus Latescibacterota bacterium]
MRKTKAFPIVVSGPSGVGKTTLVEKLTFGDSSLRRSVSVTTRPKRNGEKEGDSYNFVDKEEFEKLKQDKLVEWAEVHGHFYGTPRDFVEGSLEKGLDVVLNIDVQGGNRVKKAFPDAVMIFILPPSFEVLEQRIRHRNTDFEGEIELRLANAREEIKALRQYEYAVVNDDLDEAVSAIRAIIEAERSRRVRYDTTFIEQFGNGSF